LGKHLNDSFDCSLFEQNESIRSETLKNGWHGEVLNRRKSGIEFMVELWTSVVKIDFGHPIALVGIARDITNVSALKSQSVSRKKYFEWCLKMSLTAGIFMKKI